MSTQYPVLYNRPINKWKVAELKEELKRRNLMIKGLKDDLVRRLDEAIRNERASLEIQEQRDLHLINEPLGELNQPMVQSHCVQMAGDAGKKDANNVILHNFMSEVNMISGTSQLDQGEATGGSVAIPSIVESVVSDNPVGILDKMDECPSRPISSGESLVGVLGSSGATKENASLRPEQGDDWVEAGNFENIENSISEAENEEIDVVPAASSDKALDNSVIKLQNDYLKPLQMDAESHVSYSSNQVYEISSNLGFQVQCESIKTDTLSNFEKTEMKENLNANNVQLEPEVVRPEMAQPSSHIDPSGDCSFYTLDDNAADVKQGFVVEADDDKHNMKISEKTYNADDVSAINHIMENKTTDQVADDNELAQVPSTENRNLDDTVKPDVPLEHMDPCFEEKLDNAASIEQRESQDNKSSHAKFSEVIDMTDGEPLEKINLDQSSADDSMEDDILETKHTDSDFNPKKVDNETKSTAEIVQKAADVIEALQADIPATISVSSDAVATSPEKRKFEVEPAPDNKETRKRQRGWNDESVKMPRQQSSDVSLSTMSKFVFQAAPTTPSYDSYNPASGGDTSNERVVPPSLKAPTNSLRIDNFLRPFTLKAVQELLSKTGTYSKFWMDHIKTHCYVTYTSVEEAIETRNAIYNLQWPANGGRHLIAEFVDPEEVKLRVGAPSQSAAPVNSSSVLPSPPPAKQLAPVHQQDTRQATYDPSAARERFPLARSPVAQRIDQPIVTLDDLFRKTRATPRIYYLPLTDEEVAVKLTRQRK